MNPTRIPNSQPSCENCISCKDSLFGSLTRDELADLTANKAFHFYKKGQVIFHEGNYPAGLYCIFSGKVKVFKLGFDGREQIVRLAKPGKLLGYRALLSGDKYYASATALEDTYVCFYPKAYYLQLLQSNFKLATQTINLLSNDLRFAEKMIMNLAQKHVKARVAEALCTLQDYYGFDADGVTINTVVKREDIGNMAGTTTETTIRVLSEFNKDDVITLTGKKIRINKLTVLQQIADEK